jgi:hypothetical protein
MSKQKPSLQDILKKRQQDWQNTFNLAVCHLAAGQTAVARKLYYEGASAPGSSTQEAIDDLEDFLTVRPGDEQATAMRDFLQQLLDKRTAGDNEGIKRVEGSNP